MGMAGDVNGDGDGDFLAGDWQDPSSSYLFLGGPSGLSWWPDDVTREGGDPTL